MFFLLELFILLFQFAYLFHQRGYDCFFLITNDVKSLLDELLELEVALLERRILLLESLVLPLELIFGQVSLLLVAALLRHRRRLSLCQFVRIFFYIGRFQRVRHSRHNFLHLVHHHITAAEPGLRGKSLDDLLRLAGLARFFLIAGRGVEPFFGVLFRGAVRCD